MQLPCPGDTTHLTSADTRFGTDVVTQSDSVQNRLLQCSGFCPESTTAMLCCSKCRTLLLGSCFKRRDDPMLCRLHWLPVEQGIIYKMAVLTFKVRSNATPAYLNRHIQTCDCAWNLSSSSAPLLAQPSRETYFAATDFVTRHLLSGTHFLGRYLTVHH